jgi:hypothetical protein
MVSPPRWFWPARVDFRNARSIGTVDFSPLATASRNAIEPMNEPPRRHALPECLCVNSLLSSSPLVTTSVPGQPLRPPCSPSARPGLPCLSVRDPWQDPAYRQRSRTGGQRARRAVPTSWSSTVRALRAIRPPGSGVSGHGRNPRPRARPCDDPRLLRERGRARLQPSRSSHWPNRRGTPSMPVVIDNGNGTLIYGVTQIRETIGGHGAELTSS